jgi:hypothetical protein
MTNYSSSLNENEFLCLEKSPTQELLLLASIIYITIGGVVSTINFLVNFMFLLFFIANDKAKRSPICVICLFLAFFNIIKQSEYLLSTLIKTELIKVVDSHVLSNKEPNDFICKWIQFLPLFSSHIGVYLTLLLQIQRLVAINKAYVILLYNRALTYFICVSLVFFFLIIDEFYLYENYYHTITYCPMTRIYTCIINDKFKLLKSIKFNTLMYHHVHTLFYNVVPTLLIIAINASIVIGLRKENQINQNKAQEQGLNARSTKEDKLTQQKTRSPLLRRASSLDEFLKPKDRTRLNSTVLISNSTIQNVGFVIKRPKNKKKPYSKLNEIFINITDVNYICIVVTSIQIFNTFPTNTFSYLIEWNTKVIDGLSKLHDKLKAFNMTLGSFKSNNYSDRYFNIPNEMIGEQKFETQANLYFIYLSVSIVELFNFSFILLYQIFSCNSLRKEFKLWSCSILNRILCRKTLPKRVVIFK